MRDSRYTYNDTVVLDVPSNFDGHAIWYDDNGDDQEKIVELPEDGEYEILSIDYERGFIYNLRLEGEVDDFDYIRVWGVPEEAISLK